MSKRTKIDGVTGNGSTNSTTAQLEGEETMSSEIEAQNMDEVLITLTRRDLQMPVTFSVSQNEVERRNGKSYKLLEMIDYSSLTGFQILAGLTSSLVIKVQNKLREQLEKGVLPAQAIETYKIDGKIDPSTVTNFRRLAEEALLRKAERQQKAVKNSPTKLLLKELLARGVQLSEEQMKALGD